MMGWFSRNNEQWEHLVDEVAALNARVDGSVKSINAIYKRLSIMEAHIDRALESRDYQIRSLTTSLLSLQSLVSNLYTAETATINQLRFLENSLSVAEDLLSSTEYHAPYRVIKEKLRERYGLSVPFPVVPTSTTEASTPTPTPTPSEVPTHGEILNNSSTETGTESPVVRPAESGQDSPSGDASV